MTAGDRPLDSLSDEELGRLVRRTAAFRAAAACAEFAGAAGELRENDSLAFDRLIAETHDRQPTSVSKRHTTQKIVETFLDVIDNHANMAAFPEDAVEESAGDILDDTETTH